MADHWRDRIATKIEADAKTGWIYAVDHDGNGCRHYPDGRVEIVVPADKRATDFRAVFNDAD
jgi:hypothetical protein